MYVLYNGVVEERAGLLESQEGRLCMWLICLNFYFCSDSKLYLSTVPTYLRYRILVKVLGPIRSCLYYL